MVEINQDKQENKEKKKKIVINKNIKNIFQKYKKSIWTYILIALIYVLAFIMLKFNINIEKEYAKSTSLLNALYIFISAIGPIFYLLIDKKNNDFSAKEKSIGYFLGLIILFIAFWIPLLIANIIGETYTIYFTQIIGFIVVGYILSNYITIVLEGFRYKTFGLIFYYLLAFVLIKLLGVNKILALLNDYNYGFISVYKFIMHIFVIIILNYIILLIDVRNKKNNLVKYLRAKEIELEVEIKFIKQNSEKENIEKENGKKVTDSKKDIKKLNNEEANLENIKSKVSEIRKQLLELNKDQKRNFLSVSLFIFLIILISIWANVHQIKYAYILDETKDNIYSLSEKTKTKLAEIKDPLIYISYIQNDNKNVNVLLDQAHRKNKKIIHVNGKIDKYLKEKLIFNQKTINNIKNTWLTVENSVDREKQVNEDVLKNRIYLIMPYTNNKTIILGPLNGAEELSNKNNIKINYENMIFSPTLSIYYMPNETNFGILKGYNEIATKERYMEAYSDLQMNGYNISEINLMYNIPKNIKTIFMCSPEEDLTERETEHLKNFVNRGGNIIYLFQNLQNGKMQEPPQGIADVIASYGIVLQPMQILEQDIKNRRIYVQEEKQENIKEQIRKKYNEETTIEEMQELYKELNDANYSVDNSIIFSDIEENSQTLKQLREEGAYITTVIPGAVRFLPEYIKENNIDVEQLITTSKGAISFNSYELEREKLKDVYGADFSKEKMNIGPFTLAAIAKKPVEDGKESKLLAFSNASFIFSQVLSDVDPETSLYNYSDNREIFLETVNTLTENNNRISISKFIDIDENMNESKLSLIAVISFIIFLSPFAIELIKKYKNKTETNVKI